MLSSNLSYRLQSSWRFLVAVITPFALLPLLFIKEGNIKNEDEGTSRPETKFETAYVIIMMSIYWVLEVIPLPVTSLLPLFFLPILGVQDAYKVSQNYTKESNMIFLTGVIVALALEYCNLHRRIALKVMLIIGSSPARLLFGTMLITSFLAMWISSTTCVAMLVPVVTAIIDEILESPEIMSTQQLRRLSMQQSTDAEKADGQSQNSEMTGPPASPSSNWSNQSRPVERRRSSTVFANPSLARTRSSEVATKAIANGRRLTITSIPVNQVPNSQSPADSPKPRQLSMIRAELAMEGPLPGKTANKFYPSLASPHEPNKTMSVRIEEEHFSQDKLNQGVNDSETKVTDSELPDEELEKRKSDLKKMYLFAMAYASNIGGTAVITASSPNKVFKEIIKYVNVSQGGKYLDVTFFTWLAFNLPAMMLNVFIAWIYLVYYYDGIKDWGKVPIIGIFVSLWKKKKPTEEDPQEEHLRRWKSHAVGSLLRAEYKKLGPINFHEVAVGVVFVGVVLLWILRDPDVFSGWSTLFKGASVGDSTGAMFGVLLLFIIPKDFSFLSADKDSSSEYETLLSWKFTSAKMPWGVLLLLGSGFAIADAFEYSGLSAWLGEELELLGEVSTPVLLLIVILFTSVLTEVCSNVASAIIMLPIVLSLSRTLDIHPLYLTIPTTVASSYAFMLPVAAPSNAIIFATGNFTTAEMLKNGLFLNIICIVVLYFNTITYGEWLFKFSQYEYPPEDD